MKPPRPANYTTLFNERPAGADGCELSTDIYTPTGEALGVVLVRTPYDNNHFHRQGLHIVSGRAADFKALAESGLIVVAQDVRGRGDSDGTFVPFVHEPSDGAATIDWVRARYGPSIPLFLFGVGYAAFCAWAAALERPSDVAGVASVSSFPGVHSGLFQDNGIARLDAVQWLHMTSNRMLQPPDLAAWHYGWSRHPRSLPELAASMSLPSATSRWLEEVLPDIDALRPRLGALDVPTLHITGWWDQGLDATAADFDARAATGGRHVDAQLIIGPWDHESVKRRRGIPPGPTAGRRAVTLARDWYLHLVAGTHEPGCRLRLHRTGRGVWDVHPHWPDTSPRELFPGRSTSTIANADGTLSAVAGPPSADLLSCPTLPYSWQPDFTSFAATGRAGIDLDLTHLDARSDVLSYTSEPAVRPWVISGHPQFEVVTVSDGRSQLIVVLSDVAPGRSGGTYLSHGVTALTAQDDRARSRARIRMRRIHHELRPTHRLRLTILPTLYPLYAACPHPAHARPAAHASEIQLGTATSLLLPVVAPPHVDPNGAGPELAD